jgi:hypothetical protein
MDPIRSLPGHLTDQGLKLAAHRAGLPGEEASFILCPLTPPSRFGGTGHVPAIEPSLAKPAGKRYCC